MQQTDLIERLLYAAAVLETHADKFPVPEHIPAKVKDIRQAADALAQRDAEIVRLREQVRDLIVSAYIAGATDVHVFWQNGGTAREPDFGEAASDYASCQALGATDAA